MTEATPELSFAARSPSWLSWSYSSQTYQYRFPQVISFLILFPIYPSELERLKPAIRLYVAAAAHLYHGRTVEASLTKSYEPIDLWRFATSVSFAVTMSQPIKDPLGATGRERKNRS